MVKGTTTISGYVGRYYRCQCGYPATDETYIKGPFTGLCMDTHRGEDGIVDGSLLAVTVREGWDKRQLHTWVDWEAAFDVTDAQIEKQKPPKRNQSHADATPKLLDLPGMGNWQ